MTTHLAPADKRDDETAIECALCGATDLGWSNQWWRNRAGLRFCSRSHRQRYNARNKVLAERDNFAPGRLCNVQLYVRSMGKLLRVRAVFGTSLDDVAAANRLMERDDRLCVVAETDGMSLLADKYDQGERTQEPTR